MRRSLVFALRSRNIDVLTANEAEMVNRPDKEHLLVAAAAGRTLYSYNVADYCSLHQNCLASGQSHGGIILSAQQKYSTGEEMRRLMHVLSRLDSEQMQNRLEFLSNWT